MSQATYIYQDDAAGKQEGKIEGILRKMLDVDDLRGGGALLAERKREIQDVPGE